MDHYQLNLDTSEVDFLLKRFNDRQQKILKEQNELIQNLTYKVRYATLFPGWLIKLFWAWCFLNLLAWGFSIYLIFQWPEMEEIAYQKGEQDSTAHFKEFFLQNPEAREAYEDWIKKSSKK